MRRGVRGEVRASGNPTPNPSPLAGGERAKTSIDAAAVVIAAGAWTSEIKTSATNSSAVQIEPVRGQMICFQNAPPLTRHVIYSSRGYLVPRRDGRLLAGSTSERVGFDKRVTDEGAISIKSMAFEIAPGLESAAIVDSWAGFRPHAPDDLPVLGPAADITVCFTPPVITETASCWRRLRLRLLLKPF